MSAAKLYNELPPICLNNNNNKNLYKKIPYLNV